MVLADPSGDGEISRGLCIACVVCCLMSILPSFHVAGVCTNNALLDQVLQEEGR